MMADEAGDRRRLAAHHVLLEDVVAVGRLGDLDAELVTALAHQAVDARVPDATLPVDVVELIGMLPLEKREEPAQVAAGRGLAVTRAGLGRGLRLGYQNLRASRQDGEVHAVGARSLRGCTPSGLRPSASHVVHVLSMLTDSIPATTSRQPRAPPASGLRLTVWCRD